MEKFERRTTETNVTETFKCSICNFTKEVESANDYQNQHKCKLVNLVGERLLIKIPDDYAMHYVNSIQQAAAYEVIVLEAEGINGEPTIGEDGEFSTLYSKYLVKLQFDDGDHKLWLDDENLIVLKKLVRKN